MPKYLHQLLTMLKSPTKTTVIYISCCALLSLVLSYGGNPLSSGIRSLLGYVGTISAGESAVSLAEIGGKGDSSLTATPSSIVSAIACALQNGASSIILLADSIEPDTVQLSGSFASLLEGEEVPLSDLASPLSRDIDNLRRIFSEERILHLALLTDRRRELPGSLPDKVSPLNIKKGNYTPGIAAPGKELVSSCDSFIPLDRLKKVPYTATLDQIPVPNAALLGLKDYYGGEIRKSFHGITIDGPESSVYIPSADGRSTGFPLSPGKKSTITEFSFSELAAYYSLLQAREEKYTFLAGIAGHDAYPEIAAARHTFLQNSFPFVSKKDSQDFFTMYMEARDDAALIEKNILENVNQLLKEDSLSFVESGKVSQTIDEIRELEERIEKYSSLKGKICIISAIPFYAEKGSSPAYRCAAFIDAVHKRKVFASLTVPGGILIVCILSIVLFRLFTRKIHIPIGRGIVIISSICLFFQILLFASARIYIDIMYTQGFCLLTWLCFLGEIPVRALYLDRTRLRYGVNLPSETVDSIARGIAVPPSSRQNGIILECSIGRFRELESELSWRKYSTVIKNICSIISSSAEKHGGMESRFGEGMFRYCFLSHTGNTDEVVGRAVAAAKEMEKNFREYLLTINRKKNIPLTFSAALTSGKGTPLRTPQKGRSRIVFVSKENDILPELVSLNREYGSSIIITEDIFLILGDNNDVRLLDRVRLPKSRITVTVLQIINSSAPDVHRLLEMYNTARLQFYAKQFDDARILFRKIIREFPDDGPSRVFHKRCLYYLKNSVPLQRTVDFSR